MARPIHVEKLLPLTEPMYYTLLALANPQHGYGIMQSIEKLSGGRVKIGAGTLYALLARFSKYGVIERKSEEGNDFFSDRRKVYSLTTQGKVLLLAEYQRINSLLQDGKEIMGELQQDKT